ncbi:hypothetical protein HUJ04_011071 [Dendroctonus ponderosae]|nr:hypothetical protein HUJ04_011071 [Dendroctonus ponderosae]
MESYSFLKDYLTDIVSAITFARLKILHSSIITPNDLVESLKLISQSLLTYNLPLHSSNVAEYLDIIELQAYQIGPRIVFVLNIPLVDPEKYTLYHLYPIPILDSRTGLHHVLITHFQYLARNDDSLLYATIRNPAECKSIKKNEKICSNVFPYPIDSDAICEAQLLKRLNQLPKTCQTTLIYAAEYNIQEVSQNNHPVIIPYTCCKDIPDNIHLPELKPLKLSKLDVEDLKIAQHKLNQYSDELDKLLNQSFVSKHLNWFTTLTITLIVILVILYITCKCKRRKRKFRIGITASNDDFPPLPPSQPENTFVNQWKKIMPKRRPSINLREPIEENEEIELNLNKQLV